MKHYKSVFENEQELLKAIIDIHLGGKDIECDPMYFKGAFYKDGVKRPKYCYDINKSLCVNEELKQPLLDKEMDIRPVHGDARELHWHRNSSFNSMILDPLFLFGLHGKAKDYYTSTTMGIYENFHDLEFDYKSLLEEAYRLLKKKGILIFKCQDYTDSKTTMTHALVYNWAIAQGFYAKDLAILIKPNKVYNPNTTQRHFRKIHTYFWIFKKL